MICPNSICILNFQKWLDLYLMFSQNLTSVSYKTYWVYRLLLVQNPNAYVRSQSGAMHLKKKSCLVQPYFHVQYRMCLCIMSVLDAQASTNSQVFVQVNSSCTTDPPSEQEFLFTFYHYMLNEIWFFFFACMGHF